MSEQSMQHCALSWRDFDIERILGILGIFLRTVRSSNTSKIVNAVLRKFEALGLSVNKIAVEALD